MHGTTKLLKQGFIEKCDFLHSFFKISFEKMRFHFSHCLFSFFALKLLLLFLFRYLKTDPTIKNTLSVNNAPRSQSQTENSVYVKIDEKIPSKIRTSKRTMKNLKIVVQKIVNLNFLSSDKDQKRKFDIQRK